LDEKTARVQNSNEKVRNKGSGDELSKPDVTEIKKTDSKDSSEQTSNLNVQIQTKTLSESNSNTTLPNLPRQKKPFSISTAKPKDSYSSTKHSDSKFEDSDHGGTSTTSKNPLYPKRFQIIETLEKKKGAPPRPSTATHQKPSQHPPPPKSSTKNTSLNTSLSKSILRNSNPHYPPNPAQAPTATTKAPSPAIPPRRQTLANRLTVKDQKVAELSSINEQKFIVLFVSILFLQGLYEECERWLKILIDYSIEKCY
jgi:hypothetical protein